MDGRISSGLIISAGDGISVMALDLSNFRIVTKLLLLIGVMTAVVATVAVTGYTGLDRVSDGISDVRLGGTEMLLGARARQNVIAMSRSVYHVAANPSAANVEDARSKISEARTQFAERTRQLEATADETQKSLLSRIRSAYDHYSAGIDATLTLADRLSGNIDNDEYRNQILGAVREDRQRVDALEEVLLAFGTHTDDAATKTEAEASSTAHAAQRLMLIVASMGIVGGALIGYLIARFTIAAPITQSVTALQQLADGRIETVIPGVGRGDEIGDIATTMETFKSNLIRNREMEAEAQEKARLEAEKLERLVRLTADFDSRASGVVNAVSSAATELQATAVQLASAVEETSNQSAAVAASATQANGNVQTVAAAAEELSSAIREVTQQVSDASAKCNTTSTGASDAEHELDDLMRAINQVGEIIDAINAVADQTNLLALNATIEAARAGEAGKGFAVVAAEVKQLATQTKQMTQSIIDTVSAVKASSDRAFKATHAVISQIGEIDAATASMAAALEQQSAATGEISRSAQEAAVGTDAVTDNIGSVQTAATQTGQAAENVRTASDDLARQSETLKSEVARFLQDVRAA